MVAVDEEVWARDREIAASASPWILSLRLVSALDDSAAATAVASAIDAGRTDGDRFGYWSVDVEPAGVVVRHWGFATDFRAALERVASALAAKGVDARFEAHDPAPPLPLDAGVLERDEELLECHLRVSGRRWLDRDPNDEESARKLGRREPPARHVRWLPDREELLRGVEAALSWVEDHPAGSRLRLLVNGDLQLVLSADEARGRIAAAASDRFAVKPTMAVWWESSRRFRLAGVGIESGDISLVEGGADLAAGGWQSPYEALLGRLREASAWAAYGFVKRGRRARDVLASSLTYDWVPALHYGSYNLVNSAYEDVLAPDAFGAQLLGPGYAGRIRADPEWTAEKVGAATLVVHRDPEAWFGRPLPPITAQDCIDRSPSYPTPEVILRGRKTFSDILLTYDVVREGALDPLA